MILSEIRWCCHHSSKTTIWILTIWKSTTLCRTPKTRYLNSCIQAQAPSGRANHTSRAKRVRYTQRVSLMAIVCLAKGRRTVSLRPLPERIVSQLARMSRQRGFGKSGRTEGRAFAREARDIHISGRKSVSPTAVYLRGRKANKKALGPPLRVAIPF